MLGLKLMLADEDGTVLDCGKDRRKDNTGPDWKQLSLARVVRSASSRNAPSIERLPKQTATIYLVPPTSEAALSLLNELEERAGAFEGMSGLAIRHGWINGAQGQSL